MSGHRDVFDLSTTELRTDWSLIEASAGTGKTFSIAGLVVRLVAEGFVDDVREILVVTFTIDATEELKTRVREALARAIDVLDRPDDFAGDASVAHVLAAGERAGRAVARERLVRALRAYDHVAIQTIHAFCHRVLQDAAFESGTAFDLAFSDDEDELIARAMDDAWRHVFGEVDPWVTAYAKAERLDPAGLAREFNTWRRATEARFEPHVELDDALAGWRDAFAALTDAYTDVDEAASALVDVAFNQSYRDRYGTGEDVAAWMRRLEERVDPRWFTCCKDLAAGVIEGEMAKASRDAFVGHPLFDVLASAQPAADAIGHALVRRLFDETSACLAAIREREHVVSFHDVLADLDRALGDDELGPRLVENVSSRIRVALIDEFQDTDTLQYEIFRRLFAGRTVMIIGDPKQAIYRFRGADVFAYLRAAEGAARSFTLDRNWRSHPDLVDGVQALFGHSPRPFVFDAIGIGGVKAARSVDETSVDGLDETPFTIAFVPDQRCRGKSSVGERIVLRHVVTRCVEWLGSGAAIDGRPVAPSDIAVLVRTNTQASRVEAALKGAGVPAVVGRADDVLKTRGVDELLRVLAAIAHPGDARSVRAACATHLVGDDAAALAALLDDDDAWQARVDEFAAARRRWEYSGLVAAVDHAFGSWRTRERLLALPDGERRLGNLAHAVEVLHDAARRRSLSPQGVVEWLRAERERVIVPEDRQLRLEREGAAVRVVTLHASKGLEYGFVLCPFQPIARSAKPPLVVHEGGEVVFDVGSPRADERKRVQQAEELAEDLRLLYVATTRARRRLEVVLDANADSIKRSPLSYLLLGRDIDVPSETDVTAASERIDALGELKTPIPLRDALDRFAAAHPELVDVVDVDTDESTPLPTWSGGASDGAPLVPAVQRIRDEQLDAWTLMSFSSWIRGEADERPDHEDAVADEPRGAASSLAPLGDVAALARGPEAGVALHAVLEHTDLSRVADDAHLQDVARRQLARHDLLDPGRHDPPLDDPSAVVARLVRRVLTTEVPGWGFRFADVDPARRRAEWSFVLPTGALEPRALGAVFAAHGRADVAERMAALSAERLRGYLVGFVDDVVEHDGRFFVVDWKSNHLGDDAADYAPGRLDDVVAHHHYDLQLTLYVVALQRFLRTRLRDAYDPRVHLGGAVDVFLRGVGTGPGHGFRFTQPEPALVEALETFLAGEPS